MVNELRVPEVSTLLCFLRICSEVGQSDQCTPVGLCTRELDKPLLISAVERSGYWGATIAASMFGGA